MATLSSIPLTNVQAVDIKDTLNSNGGSCSNELLSFFASTANINPWSRAKPVHIEKSIEPDRSSAWYKGTSGTCGFNLSGASTTNYTNLPSMYTSDKKNGWNYAPPQGGSFSPYRLGDFAGYLPSALPPITGFSVPSSAANTSGSSVTAAAGYNVPSEEGTIPGSLTFAEIGGFSVDGTPADIADLYFGVYITKGGSSIMRLTNTTKGLLEVSIPTYLLTEGDHVVYPFMCTSIQYVGESDYAGVYYTLPNASAGTMTIVASTVIIYITASYNYISGVKKSVSVTVQVVNKSGQGSFTNNIMRLRYANKGYNDTMDSKGEVEMALADFSLATGGTATITDNKTSLIAIPSGYESRSYVLYVGLSSSKYVQGPQNIGEVTQPT